MITVRVDGLDMPAEFSGLKTMGELVELVKTTIDPDTIITSMNLGGNPLDDADWRAPLVTQQDAVLEITTGGKNEYVNERLQAAEFYLTKIIQAFAESSEKFRSGKSDDANLQFAGTVEDLLAFVSWYLVVLSVEPEKNQKQVDEFNVEVNELKKVCEALLQQQMFQSWWALGETIQSRLNPRLEAIKELCLRNSVAQ